jgi:transposase
VIFDRVDTDVFQFHLDHLAQEIPAVDSKRRLLIVDNASRHKTKRLNWQHFELHFLLGYSPDFNPIERLWLRLKADFFSNFIAKSSEEPTKRPCHGFKHPVFYALVESMQHENHTQRFREERQ